MIVSYVIAHRRNDDGDIVESGVFDTEADDVPAWVTEFVAEGASKGTAEEPALKEWDSSEDLSPMTQQIIAEPFRDGSEEDASEDEDEPAEDEPAEVPVPPQGGPGSGRDKWVAYAESKGIVVTAEDGRDEIIEKLESSGISID